MPIRLLHLLLPFAALLLFGCSSTQQHFFHGRVDNLLVAGLIEEGVRAAPILRLERNPVTRTFMALQIDQDVALVVAFLEPLSSSEAKIRPPQLKAWLLKEPVHQDEQLSAQVQSASARPLRGPMVLHWRKPGIFHLTMNLRTGEEPPAILHGEIKTERDWHIHY